MRRLTSLLALSAVLLAVLLVVQGGPATAQDKKDDKAKKAKKADKAKKKAPTKKIFTDAKLEAVIKAILKKKQAKTDPIMEADLKTIFFLEAPGKSITNLAGLALVECHVAAELGEVVVMAPDGPLSGCSHQVTLDKPLVVNSHGRNLFSINGTPADCVRMGLVEQKLEIDWVLSGVNAGANLGVDVYMSGTVGATREAGLFHVPAIALSQFIRHNGPFDWSKGAAMLRSTLETLLGRRPVAGAYFNVNFPDPRDVAESARLIECALDPHPLPVAYHPAGQGVMYGIDYFNRPCDPGTDVDVCFGGAISLTEVVPVCAAHAAADSSWRSQASNE